MPLVKSHPAPQVRETKSVVHGQKKKVLNAIIPLLTCTESTLFAGLETVQGPSWAAILQLYGPGGSISEALKDRSQVQLNDKACNLKLVFLKGGHKVPPALERVTGRLKGDRAGDGTDIPGRNKRRKTGDATAAAEGFKGISSETAQYTDGQNTSQGQVFTMAAPAPNVDPGLQMPQGS